MKITKSQKGDGYTAYMSLDELRLNGVALTEFRPAPEERGLHRKMTQQVVTALPIVDEDPPEEKIDEDPDADLFEEEKPIAKEQSDGWTF